MNGFWSVMGVAQRTSFGTRIEPRHLPFLPDDPDNRWKDAYFHIEGICVEGPVVVRVLERYVDHREQPCLIVYQIYEGPGMHGWAARDKGEWLGYWEPRVRLTAWERLLDEALMV